MTERSDPTIPSRFDVREELYRGPQNVRLRAFDSMVQQEVVLEFSGAGARELEDRKNLLRQARMRARVKHPNIQPLKDVHYTPNGVVHVLEPSPGETLESVLERAGRLKPSEVTALGIELADALQALHAGGIVHRAVSASNILVHEPGRLSVITGFAYAKPIDPGHMSSLQYAPENAGRDILAALPEHPAPEQVHGQPADARSDVFALGCVLYRCLTGRQAFPGRTDFETPVSPVKVAPDVPASLADTVLKCLQPSPMSRYKTMHELAEALRASSGTTPGKSRSARQWLVLGGIAAAVIVAQIVGPHYWNGGAKTDPSRGSTAARNDAPTYKPEYGKSHALLIGVNYEGNAAIPKKLAKAEQDADAVAAELRALGFEPPTVLKGKQATEAAIRKALHDLETKMGPDDQVFVWFSGHGDLHSNTDARDPSGYVLPWDATKRLPNSGKGRHWLSLSDFTNALREYPAKHVLIAFDCCHSGAVFGTTRSLGKQPPRKDVAVAAHGYKAAYLRRKAKILMVSCAAEDLAADESVFAKGFLTKLREARRSPVTHTAIEAHIKDLIARGGYLQLPNARNVGGTSSEFVFMKR